ncbi:LysR substrate-binding domain-containing protein [uncultured Roseobacter sp.]|uniref:LysR substrate-binding domain-containing protein n=1 Tax=uncultured Roseobacter sp. TaxID=114847 RepID=UPI002609A813|nr:LysR substrate-binding domain-containing protein [uncultured Roseobacter sp.]
MTLPPLGRLRPFESAARLESFSMAAAELGMTQTAVSKQIAALERELGVSLFERRNRAVFLTDAGRRLGRVASGALSDIDTEMAALQGRRRSKELILHCQLCEAFYWLMPRLSKFHERYPGVELRVVSSRNPLKETQEAFDVAMQTSGRASGSARMAFTAADDVFPVCAPSLVAEEQLPLDPRKIASFPLLVHAVARQDWMVWEDWFKSVGSRPSNRARHIAFDSYPLALQAAVAGQGIALGWRRTTEGMIAEGKLIRPCREKVERPTEISVYRSASSQPHPNTDQLIAWLQDQLSK